MKTIKLLLMLALILPSASAAITFSLSPSTQNANPGDIVTVQLNLNTDQAIWGASVKLDFNTPITYNSNTPGTVLSGSFQGVTQNTHTRITPYAVFAGNGQGIPAGNNKLFDLSFTIPADAQPGQYQLSLTQPAASDQNGNPLEASTIGTATINVQSEQENKAGFSLPDVNTGLEEGLDIPICVTNTQSRTLTSIDITISNDQNIVIPTEAVVLQGTGNVEIQPGSTRITINNLNIQNTDCEQGNGANVAYIHYQPLAIGVSPLHIQSASAQDQTAQLFSIQALENTDGQISIIASQLTKHCTPNLGVITPNQAVTITYKISNPGKPTTISNNIGGIYNEDTFDDTNFNPTLPPTNLQPGSSLSHNYTASSGVIEVAQTESPLPLLTGPGTHNIYSIVYDSILTIPPGVYVFNFNAPPPPALEVSDEFSNNMPANKISCSVQVIEGCRQDSDCDDGLACNGQETCNVQENICEAGTELNCDDGNQCTNDFCQEPTGCQHTIIPGCGEQQKGGGGGGSGQQTVYVCSICNNTEYPEYDKCCGINEENAIKFCKKPTAYKQFCTLVKETNAPVIQQPVTEAPTIAEEKPVQENITIEEKPVPPPTKHLAGKAISEGETKETPITVGVLLVGGLVLVLMATFAIRLLLTGKKPETPIPPIEKPPIEEPEVKAPTEIIQPAPEEIIETVPEAIAEKIEEEKIEEPPKIIPRKPPIIKKPAPKIIYKPVKGKPVEEAPLNKYEAEVRKKLAKAIKRRR